MGTEPNSLEIRPDPSPAASHVWAWLTALAVIVGLALAIDTIFKNSATYDEVAYLRIAARWWRTGDQSEITRMGSPVTFWKLQQAPALWLLDRMGHREWIDEPIVHQRRLLPVARLGSLWIWLVAIGTTVAWARQSNGQRAMAFAAWLFVLSPNLIAHGTLATMELPLVAASTATFWFFWRFLDSRSGRWFWASAATAGLAFSCKFTAIIFPPIIGVVWWLARWREGDMRPLSLTLHVWSRVLAFVVIMLVTNLALTGFARIPLSTTRGEHPSLERWVGTRAAGEITRLYETPLPQDWVAFATQMHHQASGGPSYLWGERRLKGWWYYYFVALAVKVPLGLWLLVVARLTVGNAKEITCGIRDGIVAEPENTRSHAPTRERPSRRSAARPSSIREVVRGLLVGRKGSHKLGAEGVSAVTAGTSKGLDERAVSRRRFAGSYCGRFVLRWLGRPLTRPAGTLSPVGRREDGAGVSLEERQGLSEDRRANDTSSPSPLRGKGRGEGGAQRRQHTALLPLVSALFLAITAVGSSRNYGIRYLLPLAPLAIVWVSAVAESRRSAWSRIAVVVSLAGLVAAVASSHPYELTYFNVLAHGPEGGRHILADSNLDWGQGLESLARLQQERPEFRNITFYYFGDTDPAHYGVSGRFHVINAVDDQSLLPGLDRAKTPYLAVSASLQFGPWGPSGFFRELDRLKPVHKTDDTTIAIYRTADLTDFLAAHQ